MLLLTILTFAIGYLAIVFEHPLKLDKTVPALLIGVLCWTWVAAGNLPLVGEDGLAAALEPTLLHHIGKTAEILIFLIAAMTIVELVDLHHGFEVITHRIHTRNKRKLMWLICWLAFFLSAVLDNLTTTIVLVSVLRKLIKDPKERMIFVSLVVIAANAGGAWSPIGDVTTTMLWVGHKVSSQWLVLTLFIPAVVNLLVPLGVLSFMPSMRGDVALEDFSKEETEKEERPYGSKAMFLVGLGSLLFVPVFKSITHLPPYMGIMLGLAATWTLSEYLHPDEDFERKQALSARNALSRIEMSSILFFLGILMAVSSLESLGLLHGLAEGMDQILPGHESVALVLGFASAIIDNVPLVAASMGMYSLPMDDTFWHFVAYTAGTGGSMLIIGSAAGVAAMGMEKINFIWYIRNVGWLALLGYLAGAGVYLLMW